MIHEPGLNADTSTDAKWQLMPPLSDDEFVALKEDIRQRGVLVSIEFDEDGAVLDGHHRLRAYHELISEGHALPPYDSVIRQLPDDEAKKRYVLSINLTRRHLSKEQKLELMFKLRAMGLTLTEVAEKAGVDPSTVKRQLDAAVASGTFANAKVLPTEVTTKDGRVMTTTFAPRILVPAERVLRAERVATSAPKMDVVENRYIIIIECEDLDHQIELMDQFEQMGLKANPQAL